MYDYKLLNFIKDVQQIPKGIDIYGYKEAITVLIRSTYSIDDVVDYERRIYDMFHSLRAKLAQPFIFKYGWLLNEIYKKHGYTDTVINPADILKLSYLRFLHLYDDLYNNFMIKKTVSSDLNDKHTVKSIISEIDHLSTQQVNYLEHYKSWEKIIYKIDWYDKEINDISSYFNNLVMYIVLHPDLYKDIMSRIKKGRYPLKHSVYFVLPNYIDLFYPFPNIRIGESYPDYFTAYENIKRRYYQSEIRYRQPATILVP